MTLTFSTAKELFPKAEEKWRAALISELSQTNIFTKPNELASFIAQIDHESAGLTIFEENLNYSAERMAQVWKRFAANPDEPDWHKRVPNNLAKLLARNPEALANHIYADANRSPAYALGNTSPGDGWKYHGRGPIQLTGRNNYLKCGNGINSDLINYPESLLMPNIGIRSSIWFWVTNGIDKLDDDNDVRLETRRINGGETGLAHRQALFDRALEIITEENVA